MCGLVFLDVSFAAHYTDKWAVHIEGGVQAAKSLTEKHGFIFLGEVGFFFLSFCNINYNPQFLIHHFKTNNNIFIS